MPRRKPAERVCINANIRNFYHTVTQPVVLAATSACTSPAPPSPAPCQYDVIRWRLHKGKNGKNVFQFQLRRRPGQGELVSQVSLPGLG